LTSRAAAIAVVVFVAATGVARADGDPASDVLISRRAFVPIDRRPSLTAEARLNDAVDSAARGGLPIRAAVIATRYDLGSVPMLYRRPKEYAKFLGQELVFAYTGRVLVVMPNGYGLWRKRAVPPRELAALNTLPPARTTDGTKLTLAADRAVRRLLTLHATPVVASPRPQQPKRTTTSDRITIVVAVLLLAAVAEATWLANGSRRLRAIRVSRVGRLRPLEGAPNGRDFRSNRAAFSHEHRETDANNQVACETPTA
jgi:hypothetical protein